MRSSAGREENAIVKPSDDTGLVCVIDDDVAIRASLDSLIRSVGLKVALFGSVQEFLANTPTQRPMCLVLDVRMPGTSGLELQAHNIKVGLTAPIIFITGHGDIQMSVRAIKAGALEFLPKPLEDQDLLDAVNEALRRDRERMAAEATERDLKTRLASLSPREREIMAEVTAGLLNKQIADRVGLSVITVKVHRGQVMRKMGARSLAALVRMADRLHLRSAAA